MNDQACLFTQFQMDEMERQTKNGTKHDVDWSGNWRLNSNYRAKRNRAKRIGRIAADFHISRGAVCPDSKEEVK